MKHIKAKVKMNINKEIIKELYSLKDDKYRVFMANLTPGIPEERFIGVRTPKLRLMAKNLSKRDDIDEFLKTLPHDNFEEDQLHAFIISEIKDYDLCLKKVNEFLPYVDNWATCDQMCVKVFKKKKKELLPEIDKWISSKKTYTIRFGVRMLMNHFLDEDFDIGYVRKVAGIKSEEYYVKMMIAWYFATALAKQYEPTVTFIEEKKLDPWTHNKAIQKAIESFRVSDEHKKYLKSLKV